MRDDVLDRVVGIVEAAPESSQALLLYALVSTLAIEKAGCMFKLNKLREMDPETRDLAYGLMELMAQERNRGPAWDQARSRMDQAVRGG